jgi:hypothetical protein
MRPQSEYEAAWPLEGLFDPEPDWSGNGRHSTSISGTSGTPNPPTAIYPPMIPGDLMIQDDDGNGGDNPVCEPGAVLTASCEPSATLTPTCEPGAILL